MKVDSVLPGVDLDMIVDQARQAEALGYDGLFTPETKHDPFFPLLLAARETERLDLGTAIALAFPRSPMHLAHIGHDLQLQTKGRFVLGLGSQIRAHVEKRFSSEFSQPVARMRELVQACRAIWRCWNEGEKLNFRGDFFQHTLMTPYFSPDPNPYGSPRIALAAVGPRMTELVGEEADAYFVHGFTTQRYMEETTKPALERGLARSGRRREEIEVAVPGFVVTGDTHEEYDKSAAEMRNIVAFYGSTPNYRGVLEVHGWGELQDELNTLSKQGRWEEMANLIDDEILETFAVTGTPEEIPDRLHERFGSFADRVTFYSPYVQDSERWASIVARFHELG